MTALDRKGQPMTEQGGGLEGQMSSEGGISSG